MTITYRVGDALDALRGEPADSAALIHLDDAWARPKRGGGFGVEYPTHPFSRDDDHYDPDEHELVVTDLIGECLRVLDANGVLLADTDSWLFSRLLPYLHETLGDGCVRTGDVVALASDGTPDCSTPGQYGASGGYSYVVASPEACPVDAPFRTPAPRQREQYGWGTVKPLKPYRAWVREFTAPGDRILVPCAGTAPTAVAAEMEHGERADVLAVDVEDDAKAAYERRRADELDRQATLNAGWSG